MKEITNKLAFELHQDLKKLESLLENQAIETGTDDSFLAATLCLTIRAHLSHHMEDVIKHPDFDASNYEQPVPGEGREALWTYFGLSYASWLTLPRVMMHAMPDEWQGLMAKLLNQWDNTYTNQPDIGTQVQVTNPNGKLTKTPKELINYRHPDKAFIARMKELSPVTGNENQ